MINEKNILILSLIFLFVVSISFINAVPILDSDNDGIPDNKDLCPNSMHWERIDKNGCDPFQFCSKFSCGNSCFYADFKGDELLKLIPNDCTVVIIAKEGKYDPKCVPIGCKKQLITPENNVSVRLKRLSSRSYFQVNLTGVIGNSTYPIINGLYSGWCVDQDHGTNNNTIYKGKMYSSLDPNLNTTCPRCYDKDWDLVNYIINHKQGTMNDIQSAIHYFIDHGVYPTDPDAISMVEEAKAHGEGYWPQEGELMAIIVDIGNKAQMLFLEIDP